MPKFSNSSKKKLESCDKRLQAIFNTIIEDVDIKIICGHRGEREQNQAYDKGYSKLKYPQSKHNSKPSKAVDVMLWYKKEPHVRWDDHKGQAYLAGYVKGLARAMGFKIRWGGDWDSDNIFDDQTFFDIPHFEIIE